MSWTDSYHHPDLRALPALSDNYIWLLRDAHSHHALVVDPGAAEPVMSALDETGLTLSAILVTHHHRDHVAGIAALRQAWPDVIVYGPTDERIPEVDVPLCGGARCRPAGMMQTFQVLTVPGHTSDHLAFFTPASPMGSPPLLFCGDTLFGAGCGRIFEGTAQQLWQSLQRLRNLPSNTLVCCAHEYTLSNLAFACAVSPNDPMLRMRLAHTTQLRQLGRSSLPSTLAMECATNPFLRTDDVAVQQFAAQKLGRRAHDALEVFTVLRRCKDAF